MQHSEKTIVNTVKKTWSDPKIVILSIKNDTLGTNPGVTDTATTS